MTALHASADTSPRTAASATSDASDASDGSGASADARLSHLFRATLRHGRIHPLYLPVLKYRQSRSAA